MSTFALVTDPKSGIYEPEQLKDKPIGVSPFNGSHFTTLKLLEGFLKREQIKTTFAGTMRERIEALKRGEVAAVSLMEPWISVAEKQGCACSWSRTPPAAKPPATSSTARRCARCSTPKPRPQAPIEKDPAKYAHYLVEEAGGMLELQGPQALAHPQRAARALHARALPAHLRVDARLGPRSAGATYENTVDNRAWQ